MKLYAQAVWVGSVVDTKGIIKREKNVACRCYRCGRPCDCDELYCVGCTIEIIIEERAAQRVCANDRCGEAAEAEEREAV